MKNIKAIIFIIILILTVNTVFSQNKSKIVDFGKQFIDTIILPSKHNYIKAVELIPIVKKDSKKYYNDPNFKYSLDDQYSKEIIVISRVDSLNRVLIPPLKPNRFYVLKVTYVGEENIFGVFRGMLSEDSIAYGKESDWMKEVKRINILMKKPFKYYYQPTNANLKELKVKLNNFDLSPKVIDTIKLEKLVFDEFKTLKFKKKDISKKSIIEFCKWLKGNEKFDAETGTKIFEYFGKIPDNQRLYDFFIKYLKTELNNAPQKYIYSSNFEDLVKISVDKEKQFLSQSLEKNEPVPNFLSYLEDAISYTNTTIQSTFAKNYETSYKRALVPDFGYIAYIPTGKEITGGAPYVGVHISLSPVNKDVPLKLSQLTFSQRFSLHTGVTLNSLKKEGYRDDFFDNYSLMLGGGYKILTQSTRLNFGGVLFKKLDAVSGKSSVAIQPYIGLSIDIEIKKWLEGIIPSFTNNFKSE